MHNAAFSVSSTFIETHTHTHTHTHSEIHTITCIEKQGYKSHSSRPPAHTLSLLQTHTQTHINTFQIAYLYIYTFIIANRCFSVVNRVALQITAHKTHSAQITHEALKSVAMQSLQRCHRNMAEHKKAKDTIIFYRKCCLFTTQWLQIEICIRVA